MTFRLNAAQLFLTYPQCTLSREDVLEKLKEKVNIFNYVIASELHANGDPHIHCWLKLWAPVNFKKPDCLDIGGFHGNYQGCRSKKNVLKYVTKDGHYITNVDISCELKSSMKSKVTKYLLEDKKSLSCICDDIPECLMGYKKLKIDYMEYMMDNSKPEFRNVECRWYYGPSRVGKSWRAIKDINLLFEDGGSAPNNPRWGLRPQTPYGVCNIRLPLQQQPQTQQPSLTGIYIKSCNKWWDGYNGELAVLLDEVPEDSDWMINFLKRWGDKLPLHLELKGGTTIAKFKYLFVTSNHSINDLFYKPFNQGRMRDIEALKNRFIEFYCPFKLF